MSRSILAIVDFGANANANRYWTKAMEPVYPDHDMTPDEGS